jgi:hypothetical protein
MPGSREFLQKTERTGSHQLLGPSRPTQGQSMERTQVFTRCPGYRGNRGICIIAVQESALGTELATSALQRLRRFFEVLLPCRPQRWAAAYARILIFTAPSSVTRSSRRS